MTKVFDKAQWHIDAGENSDDVIRKFKDVLNFLNDQDRKRSRISGESL